MRGVRWWTKRIHVAIFGGPWPRTADEWWEGAEETNDFMKQEYISVAEEIGAVDLAEEMKADDGRFFDTATYHQKLNDAHPGAGDRAGRQGIEHARRHKLDNL